MRFDEIYGGPLIYLNCINYSHGLGPCCLAGSYGIANDHEHTQENCRHGAAIIRIGVSGSTPIPDTCHAFRNDIHVLIPHS